MKKILTISILSLLFATSCEKPATQTTPNTNTNTTPVANYHLKFKLNGTEYTGYSVNGNRGVSGDGIGIAAAFDRNGKIASVSVGIVEYSGPKTYSDSFNTMIMVGDEIGDNYFQHFKNPVTIKILSDDSNGIKGEFSGTLYAEDTTKTIKITDGSFYVKMVI